jgi:membrane protease YdiL (CAAX protease family)
MEASNIRLSTLIQAVAAVLVVELTAQFTLYRGPWPALVSLGVVRIVEIILLLAILFEHAITAALLGFASADFLHGLARGLLWSLSLGAIVLLGFAVLFLVGMDPLTLVRVQLPQRRIDLFLFLIVGGLIGPVAEEIFFRAILYGFLRRWGIVTAVCLSTLIFVLIHPVGRHIPIPQAVGGVLFALSYEIEKSLVPPIVIHILGNMAIFGIGVIERYA